VALLDQAGEPALTFRALAARLGGGVGSVYWYVSGRDELLDRAADSVLAGVLADTAGATGSADPVDDLRAIAVALFDAILAHPWLGPYFLRDTGTQENGLLLFERLGQQVLRLGLPPRESLHAVSAVLGFVVGVGADLAQQPPPIEQGGLPRTAASEADRWRALDPAAFPFLHHVADAFAVHDDAELFRAGLDLLLAGLALQAGRAIGDVTG
jgi:AcrR family transcriptional regulator